MSEEANTDKWLGIAKLIRDKRPHLTQDEALELAEAAAFRKSEDIQPELGVKYDKWNLHVVDDQNVHLCRIPAGRFTMGPDENDKDAWQNEYPQHEVEITRAFWLASTPVTQALWIAVMGDNPSHFKGRDKPVEFVSWHDVQEFLKRLNELVPELHFRLPTEAEWEYACRAGTTESRYGELDDVAWCTHNSEAGTHPVGGKRPNAWGLYDMLGNVYEWCSDVFVPYGDPKVEGSFRVLRGGSWGGNARSVRAAFRYSNHPSYRSFNLGFRLAADEENRQQEEMSEGALCFINKDALRKTIDPGVKYDTGKPRWSLLTPRMESWARSYGVSGRLPLQTCGRELGDRWEILTTRWGCPNDFLSGVVRVLTFGANKHAPEGWRRSEPKLYRDAYRRHLDAGWFAGGECYDEESGEHHLLHAGACLIILYELEATELGEKGNE